MKTQRVGWNLKNLVSNSIRVVIVLTRLAFMMGCGLPTSSSYTQGYSSGTTPYGSDGVVTGSGTTGSGTTGSAQSPLVATTSSPTPSASPVAANVPSCTFVTPTIASQFGGFYVKSSITVTSSIPIATVDYSLSGADAFGTSQWIGQSTTAPYQVEYGVNSMVTGTDILSATLIDVDGNTYQSVCNTAYSITW